MDRITELRQKRAGIVENMRALLDAAAAETRDLNADENQNYQNMEAELSSLEAQIAREERVAGLEEELRQSANGSRNPGRDRQPGGRDNRNARVNESDEYRDAFLRFLVSGQVEQGLVRGEQRDVLGLGLGSGNGYGSYLAPVALERALVNEITQQNVLRRIADVRTSATDVDIPVASTHTTAYLVSEGASITASTPAFSRVQMKAYKLAALSYVTWEALEDIFLNYEGFIRDDFAAAFAAKEEYYLVKGTGSSQPGGIETEGTSALTAAAANKITADELFQLVYSVDAKYRQNGAFVMKDASLLAIRTLKDGNSQYIWQPGLQAGQPDRLLGFPIYTSSEVDGLAASKKPIFFGDFKKLRIQDRAGLYIQRLNEVAATTGQVGFVAHRRTDSHVIVPAAIKYITMHA